MFTIETKELSPEAAGARSAEFLDREITANEALDAAVRAATTGPDTVDASGIPHNAIEVQEDALMQAKKDDETARNESLAFAEEHIGPLVEAALADAQKDGVTINR